ncbi:hypothetical protein H0H92_002957 [Tricholoma furcatifolium]|nr:hypothetical protein H0H92_002957 [Tricholoma furcatifolium]
MSRDVVFDETLFPNNDPAAVAPIQPPPPPDDLDAPALEENGTTDDEDWARGLLELVGDDDAIGHDSVDGILPVHDSEEQAPFPQQASNPEPPVPDPDN